MKRLLILSILAVALFGQSPTVYNPLQVSGQVQIKPQAVPTSTTTVTISDSYMIGFTVINTTAGALTITVASREASPVALLSAVSIAANTTYVVSIPYGHWMVNGWTVTSSGAGLVYYATWKQ